MGCDTCGRPWDWGEEEKEGSEEAEEAEEIEESEEVEESESEESESEEESEEEKPKKGLSNYLRFSREMRPMLKEDEPDISFAQMGRRLGEMWRALSEEDKEAYWDG